MYEQDPLTYSPPLRAFQLDTRATIAGAVLALVTQVTFTLFGVALAASLVHNATTPRGVHDAQVFASAFSLFAMVVGGFVGGLLAGWLARGRSASGGALEGLLAWSLALLASLWFVSAGLSALVPVVAAPGAYGVHVVIPTIHAALPPTLNTTGEPVTLADRVAQVPTPWTIFLALVLSALACVLGSVAAFGARVAWLLPRRGERVGA